MLRSKFVLFIFITFGYLINGFGSVKVGMIIKKEDMDKWKIVQEILTSHQPADKNKDLGIEIYKEIVDVEDTVNYHQAFCNLLNKEVVALISSTVAPYYPILSAYAREYKIPLISPELPQEISQFSTNYSFGMKPITSRPMLKLFQQYDWSNIIYLYDHDDGPENLNLIFTVGRHVLQLNLDGMLRVSSAAEANRYLRKLDNSFKTQHFLNIKEFHVVLDTELAMARDILSLHVNDAHVGKKNFHFLLTKPTLEDFWTSQKAAFGAIKVTTFLIQNQLPEAKNVIRRTVSESEENFDISLYYYYDAALVLQEAITKFKLRQYPLRRRFQPPLAAPTKDVPQNCMDAVPKQSLDGSALSYIIGQISLNGTTGPIHFHNGNRKHFLINVTEVTPKGFNRIAYWAHGNMFPIASSRRILPTASPLVEANGRLRIVSKIKPPYMMFKKEENGPVLHGNDRFEGFCKDLIDLLAEEMKFEYDLHLVEDDTYGKYNTSEGKWTGIVNDLIHGKADLAVSDLTITGQRQRVVEFTDPFEMVGFSVVMKNPRFVSKLSNICFFVSAFTADVWICIIFSVILFCILFHFITKFTGAPDSIESASGIWGRKHTAIANIWFVIGTSMFQGTGVYPRSISSRILSGFCWFFTLILSALFIASVTAQILTGRLNDEKNPQLSQLKSLSMESIIAESISRGWPKIGMVHPSHAEDFVKRSSIPIFSELRKYLEANPDVIVNSPEEGLKRVRESSGNYIVLLESLTTEYATKLKPCDIIATHDTINYAANGLATPLGSQLMSDLNKALHVIQEKGALGHLHRKWWIETNECKNVNILDTEVRTVHVFSGLLCLSAVGIIIVLGVFGIQYMRRNQNRESRRQQLSFEDMNLGQSLPTPPPELLAEPPPVLNLPDFDKNTLL